MTSAAPPDSATCPAAIADRLRREILTGAIAPGSPIKERDHAERLGISRTPLREAVRILAKEGLVTLRPLRSPLVTDLTRAEAMDEVAVLRLLELAGGELACANATEAEIAAIAALARAVEDNHATGDKVEVFDIDMRMHRAIVAAGHNAALSRSYGEYLARLWRIRFLSARRRSDAARCWPPIAAWSMRLPPATGRRCGRTWNRIWTGWCATWTPISRMTTPRPRSRPARPSPR